MPSLHELPPPPPGKVGWPWTEESAPWPATALGGQPWPRLSILVPSFNQGEYIEEMIRSVLLQGCPDIELVIMDGGSQDQTKELLEKYAPWLGPWVSEPDEGQSHALNKALKASNGQIIGWLNTDDFFTRGEIATLMHAYAAHPDWMVVYGDMQHVDEQSQPIQMVRSRYSRQRFLRFWQFIRQLSVPSCATFFRRDVFEKVGDFDPRMHYIMDYEFFWRACRLYEFHHVPDVVSCFRIQRASKTGQGGEPFWRDAVALVEREFDGTSGSGRYARRIVKRQYWAAVATDVLYGYSSAQGFGARHFLYGLWLNPWLILRPWFWKVIVKRLIGRSTEWKPH